MGEDGFGVVSKAELLVRGSGTTKRSLKEKFGQRWMRRIPAIFEQFYYGSKFSRQRTKSFLFSSVEGEVDGLFGCSVTLDAVAVSILCTYEYERTNYVDGFLLRSVGHLSRKQRSRLHR